MKISRKSLLVLSFAFALVMLTAIFLPLQSNVKETVRFSTQGDALFRQLVRDTIWRRWWPGQVKVVNQKEAFVCEEFTFSIERILQNSFVLRITSDSFSTHSTLSLTPEGKGMMTAALITSIDIPHHPVDRVKTLLRSTRLREAYRKILANLSQHFASTKNLYDFDIHETTVPFEYLATTSSTFTHRPTTTEIYALVNEVKGYVKDHQGVETGFPMLHMSEMGRAQFFVQIAIPTDKKLPESKDIKSKWMLKGGRIIAAKIVGDHQVVLNAMKQAEYFIFDNHRAAAAISYEYLVTNRLEQPDSTQWITEIYYPII